MKMVEVKVSEIYGAALDWAVAQSECFDVNIPTSDVVWGKYGGVYSPSINWEQGGSLIHEHGVEFEWITDATIRAELPACATPGFGGTHLIAACRAIVASKFGDTVSVPAVLVEGVA